MTQGVTRSPPPDLFEWRLAGEHAEDVGGQAAFGSIAHGTTVIDHRAAGGSSRPSAGRARASRWVPPPLPSVLAGKESLSGLSGERRPYLAELARLPIAGLGRPDDERARVQNAPLHRDVAAVARCQPGAFEEHAPITRIGGLKPGVGYFEHDPPAMARRSTHLMEHEPRLDPIPYVREFQVRPRPWLDSLTRRPLLHIRGTRQSGHRLQHEEPTPRQRSFSLSIPPLGGILRWPSEGVKSRYWGRFRHRHLGTSGPGRG